MSAAERAQKIGDVSERRAALQQQICDKAKRFDLVALFQLLTWLGYSRDEIELKSHYTSLQQSSVVESVQRFGDEWQRRLRHDVRLWLATVLETSDRLGTLAATPPARAEPLRRRAAG